MVSVDPYKKYLTLDGVRVSHKRKDDTIHITSTDPDVQASGFHLALSRGTQTEETLRDLLLEHGVIRVPEPESTPDVPVEATALSVLVEQLLAKREQARENRDWQTADSVRDQLLNAGVALTENESGTVWRLENPSTGDTGTSTTATQTARKRSGMVFTVTSAKGGVGKTTMAMLLGSAIVRMTATTRKPMRVAVLDLDLRDGQVGFLIGKTAPTALNAYLRPDKSIRALEEAMVFEPKLGIHVMLAPKRARTADILSPEFYEDIIGTLANEFDVVILNTSVVHSDPLLPLVYQMSDAVILVTELSLGSVYGMTRWVDEVTTPTAEGGFGVDIGKIGVLVNKATTDVGVDQELLKQAARGAVLLAAVPYDKAVVKKANYNELADLLDDGQPHAEIRLSINTLARKLLQGSALV